MRLLEKKAPAEILLYLGSKEAPQVDYFQPFKLCFILPTPVAFLKLT